MLKQRNIYVASSWRNSYQQGVVSALRTLGHYVYDFKNPPGRAGFSWSDIDPNWEQWSSKQFVRALQSQTALEGFKSNYDAMKAADTCILVLPSGRSAHLEGGYFTGADKELFIYSPENHEPELMYLMATDIILSFDALIERFRLTF